MMIFVVDDDPGLAGMLGELLLSHDYEVAIFQSGKEALQHLEARIPNLVITDIDMPEMDGFTLRSHIMERCPGCKFILMTGGDSQEDGILRKPVRLKLLLERIRQLLGEESLSNC